MTNARLSLANFRYSFLLFATALLTILWVVIFSLNELLLPLFEESKLANWIFLPAFLRLAGVMVLGWRAIPGLFIGSIITSEIYHAEYTAEYTIEIALISSVIPWVTYEITRRFLKVSWNLMTLKPYDLIIFSATTSIATAAAHSALYIQLGLVMSFIGQFIPMVVGNFVGTVLILYLIKSILINQQFQR
jgi:hypothetical protein